MRNKKVQGHPAYIYSSYGNEFNYIGITKAKYTRRKENVKLDKNPEPKNKQAAYLRPQTDKEKKGLFSKPLNGWKFTDNDRKKAKKIIESSSSNKKISNKKTSKKKKV